MLYWPSRYKYKLIINRHIPVMQNTHTPTIIRHSCDHTHTHARTYTQTDTLILPPAHVDWQSQALSLDKRQRRTGEQAEGARKRGTGCLTPFLEPSLSNDGDIAHGFFTPSLMPLHACSTEREREEGRGGEKGRREREGEEERRGAGSPSLRVTLPPFLSRSLSWSCSLPLGCTHTQAHGACVLLPVVAYPLASLSSLSFSSPPLSPLSPALSFPSPDLPPHQQ